MTTPKVRFLRLSYFVWPVVPLMLWAGYSLYGLPYFRWSYSWLDQGQGYDPFAHRHYTRCRYIGFSKSSFTLHPQNGKCSMVKFRKEEAD